MDKSTSLGYPSTLLVSDHRKTGLSPTGHRSRQPRLWRGIGGNGSVQRLNRPQIEHRQRVGERRGLIVPPPDPYRPGPAAPDSAAGGHAEIVCLVRFALASRRCRHRTTARHGCNLPSVTTDGSLPGTWVATDSHAETDFAFLDSAPQTGIMSPSGIRTNISLHVEAHGDDRRMIRAFGADDVAGTSTLGHCSRNYVFR